MQLSKHSLVETMSSLKTDSIDVVDYAANVCRKVEEMDSVIRAFVEEENRAARLQREASELRQRYPEVDACPGLYGAVVGIKDLYYVDGFPTQAGSKLPSRLFRGAQSSLVTRIRELGALILGKTAMDEFAHSEPSPTRNPHNIQHTPGGSSSGSAAAVAAGMSPLCIGTQTSRSVIAPASFCGVIGFKPTFERVPLDGIVLMSPSLDTAGFLTQDVASMELASRLLIPDWTPSEPSNSPVVGIPEGTFMTYMSEAMNQAFYARVNQLKQAGYTVRSIQMPWDDQLDDIYAAAMYLLHGEMYRVHSVWFSEHRSLYRDMTVRALERGQQVTDEQLNRYKSVQQDFQKDLTSWMDAYRIDLWITPSQAGTAPEGDVPTGWGGMTIPWSLAGMPCISIPAGTLGGLPYGVQAIARHNEDESLLAWARALEQCFDDAGGGARDKYQKNIL